MPIELRRMSPTRIHVPHGALEHGFFGRRDDGRIRRFQSASAQGESLSRDGTTQQFTAVGPEGK
jgi:hypothetical protein